MKGDEEKIVQTGCEAYISKPICIKNLQDTIKNLVNKKGLEKTKPLI